MKKTNILVTTIVFVMSFLVSLFVLYTPIPSASLDGFSAVNAATFIAEISKEPHAVSDEVAHERVRLYLKDQLEGFVGASNVVEMNYDKALVDPDCEYDVKNLLATIPGQSPIGMLLVAHYDSRGHIGRSGELGRSYGASDDGYGVATLLEIARLFGNRTLKNSLYILLTDAEETGLYGAYMAAQEPFMANIGFVINVESRGMDGPVYMFETSTKNDRIIDLYQRAKLPVTYSIATAVYTIMPNFTDFTPFIEEGIPGMNFAILRGLYYYHSPYDSYDNISLTSIQHYGSQLMPVIEEYTSNPTYRDINYFHGRQDKVFFNLLPNVLISYTETFAIILNFILLVALVALIIYLSIKKEIKPIKILKYSGFALVSIIVMAIVGLIVSKIMAFIGHTTWSITYVRMNNTELPTALVAIAVIAGFYFLIKKFMKTNEDKKSLLLASMAVNLLLALVTGFILSGASFLFMIPVLTGLIGLYIDTFVKNKYVKHLGYGQNLIWPVLIIVPLLYSLFLALTVGGLLAILVIETLYLLVLLPTTMLQLRIESN